MWRWLTGRGAAGETPPGPEGAAASPPDERADGEISDEEILDRVAGRIVSMRMTVPAILFLESSKPLSFVGSQFLVFMEPFVKTFFTAELYDRFAELMEDREQYERLIRKIESGERSGASDASPDKAVKDDG